MRRSRPGVIIGVGALILWLACDAIGVHDAGASGTLPAPHDPAAGTGSFVLTATNTGPTYDPTFTGNGELGVRVPPEGQGYEGGAVPTQAELAGFYAQPQGGVQLRANIPTWSTLTYTDGQAFTLAHGRASQWRQSINLRTGIISTSVRWTAPDGHVSDLSYQVLADRARPHVGLVRLEVTPHWSGTASITDAIDGSPATLSTQINKGWASAQHRDWVSVQTVGTRITAALASQLEMTGVSTFASIPVDQGTDQSVGQQFTFPVVSGRHYTFTKYVGVVTSQADASPVAAAQQQARTAAAIGFSGLVKANDAAWASLWSGRIDVVGNPTLASDVNASEFYLWASTRDGVDCGNDNPGRRRSKRPFEVAGAVAGDGISRARRRSSNGVAGGVDIDAVVAVAEGFGAGDVGADEVTHQQILGGAADAHAVQAIGRDEIACEPVVPPIVLLPPVEIITPLRRFPSGAVPVASVPM